MDYLEVSIVHSKRPDSFNENLQLGHTHLKHSSSTAPTAFLESEDVIKVLMP